MNLRLDLDPIVRDFIDKIFAMQAKGEEIDAVGHVTCLRLIDAGILGTVGFKYCWREEAREDRKRFQQI